MSCVLALPMTKLRSLADRATQSAWFAYTTILLLQLKVIWGIWQYRDLTSGDTSGYFLTAYDWFTNGRTVISWSPLYTSFYGSMLSLSPDAYVATTAHRMLIVLALSVLVLALMRRLLPAPVAWVVAAWWVVLPINFESLYEVHLFAVIPLLAAYLTILYKPGPRTRGAAFGILVGSALLMRNEHILAAGLLAAIILVYEVWQVRKNGRATYPQHEYLRSYGLPLVIVCLLTLFFYSRAHDKIPTLFDAMRAKHTLNICQVYAFGYQQRHPEWTQSPWTECEPLMASTFGKPQLPLAEAVRRNPGAMMEHFLWNISLIPNGLQVLLFNATYGMMNPDYAQVHTGLKFALLCSFLLVAIYLVGFYKLYREWHYWWRHWLQPRVWGWIAMACTTVMVLFIMITQRPRPSYLFSFGLFMMAAGGFCGHVVFHRWSFYKHLSQLFAVLVGLIILFFPSYYHDTTQTNSQPLSKFYRTLVPFQDIMRVSGTVLLTAGYSSELCNYLGLGDRNCKAFWYWALRSQVKNVTDWLSVLEKHGINLFYVDESIFADPQRPQFISDPGAYGWKTIGYQNAAGRKWMLLQAPSGQKAAAPSGTVAACSFTLSTGWHGLEKSGSDWWRWTDRGQVRVVVGKDTSARLQGEIISSTSPNKMNILVNGEKATSLDIAWPAWGFKSFEPLSFHLKAGDNLIEFVSDNPPIYPSTDNRPLGIAVKNLSLTTDGGTICKLQP